MEKKSYPNSGIMFRDDRKASDKDRDYRGELNVNGVEYWVSGWVKEGQRGKFLSLAIKPKDERTADKKSTKSVAEDLNDSIPF